MKKLARQFGLLMCAAMLLSLLPVTITAVAGAVTETTQIKYTEEMSGPEVNVTGAKDGSFKMTIPGDSAEGMQTFSVSVDVAKVPYWIIHVRDIDTDNLSFLKFFVGDFYVSEARLDDRWIVVDLTPYATKGVFTGELCILQLDYHYKNKTGKRSINEIGGMWLSKSETLDGRAVKKNLLATVDFTKVINKKTVMRYDQLLWDTNVKSEKITDTSLAMWIDPDQELESYSWWGCCMWRACVDLDKVPYLYVNLAENETAYCLRIMILNSQGGMAEESHFKVYSYVTAGHSGWQIYDLKSDIKDMGFTGKQYISFDITVDDGSSASGAQNYIKEVYLDSKFTDKPGADTASKAQTPVSQAIIGDQSQSGEPDTGSAVDDDNDTSSAADSSANPRPDNVWAYIVIAVAAAMAAAGAWVFFIVKKKIRT